MITKANTYRTTARVVGVVYLAGFVVGIGGMGLFQSILGAPDHLSTVSANSMLLAFGAILWLMAVVGDAAHGVLMFPILKPHNERIAIGYLAFRIMDAIFIAIMGSSYCFKYHWAANICKQRPPTLPIFKP